VTKGDDIAQSDLYVWKSPSPSSLTFVPGTPGSPSCPREPEIPCQQTRVSIKCYITGMIK